MTCQSRGVQRPDGGQDGGGDDAACSTEGRERLTLGLQRCGARWGGAGGSGLTGGIGRAVVASVVLLAQFGRSGTLGVPCRGVRAREVARGLHGDRPELGNALAEAPVRPPDGLLTAERELLTAVRHDLVQKMAPEARDLHGIRAVALFMNLSRQEGRVGIAGE